MFSRNFKDNQMSPVDELVFSPLEVKVVNGNFEAAFRQFKTLVQNDGILADYKTASRYEKPSERKRRKSKEAAEREFLVLNREKQIASGEWDKRQKKKELKRQEKARLRREANETIDEQS